MANMPPLTPVQRLEYEIHFNQALLDVLPHNPDSNSPARTQLEAKIKALEAQLAIADGRLSPAPAPSVGSRPSEGYLVTGRPQPTDDRFQQGPMNGLAAHSPENLAISSSRRGSADPVHGNSVVFSSSSTRPQTGSSAVSVVSNQSAGLNPPPTPWAQPSLSPQLTGPSTPASALSIDLPPECAEPLSFARPPESFSIVSSVPELPLIRTDMIQRPRCRSPALLVKHIDDLEGVSPDDASRGEHRP